MMEKLVIFTGFFTHILVSTTLGENINCKGNDCTTKMECYKPCGCDGLFYFNETLSECVFNYTYYHTNILLSDAVIGPSDSISEDVLEKKIRLESEKTFSGILITAFVFVACCSIAVLAVCCYCFHMYYSDVTLSRDVNALSQRLNKDGKVVKPKKKPVEPVAQSCNVIVEDAGVFVC